MEDLELNTNVVLTNDAKKETYSDMEWKHDTLKIIHIMQDDGEI